MSRTDRRTVHGRSASAIAPLRHVEGLEEAPEARLLTRIHLRREPNTKLVQSKKRQVLKQGGALLCEVCGFDFKAEYGERGNGFIECPT